MDSLCWLRNHILHDLLSTYNATVRSILSALCVKQQDMLNHKHYPTDFLLKHFLNRCYTHFLFEGNSTGNLRNNLIVASVTGGSFV